MDDGTDGDDLDGRIAKMREDGAAWADIQRAFGVTRQQARYAYQKAKRVERRAERRGKLIST